MHVESDQPFKLALVRWVVDGVGSRLAPPIPMAAAFVLQPSGEMKAMPAQIAAARSDHGASYVNCPARVSGLSWECTLQSYTQCNTECNTLVMV